MKNKTAYLNAIYQNIRTATQSIEDIISKVDDAALKQELAKEQDGYLAFQKECEVFAKSEKIDIKDNNFMEKARLWSSINMSTMMDKSPRKIAELMLMGTFMGIITLYKDQIDHDGQVKELDELADKLKEFERQNIERLMPYLKKTN